MSTAPRKELEMPMSRCGSLLLAALGTVLACRAEPPRATMGAVSAPAARSITVRDTLLTSAVEAAGIAAPIRQAVLSTKLIGAVTAVTVREGQTVRAGQLLARIDARDIAAKRARAEAALAESETVREDAQTQLRRFRSLYADSAATKVQLEAVETAAARADAAVSAARAALRELDAAGSYAELRAPFAGVVTKRYVDPGAFAAPGAPLVAVQDDSRLRIAVSAPPELARGLRAGATLEGTIEDAPVTALVEGVVPAAGGALYTVNALVENRDRRLPAGSAATLALPQAARRALLVPEEALVTEGDLTGVRVKVAGGSELRWVRIGRRLAGRVEVLSGLAGGEELLVPFTEGAR